MSAPQPAYGLAYVVPADALAAWGARLIVNQDGATDFVHDRQGSDRGDHSSELFDLLRERFPIADMHDLLAELLADFTMDTRTGEDFIFYLDDRLVVHANTNGSAGYCYITAWSYSA